MFFYKIKNFWILFFTYNLIIGIYRYIWNCFKGIVGILVKKKTFFTVAVTVIMLFSLATNHAFAWSYSNYNYGSYVPKSGTGTATTYYDSRNFLQTRIDFKFDSYNVSSIISYNKGNGTGGSCPGYNAYVTLDQTAIPDGSSLKISAWEVLTNLPNPKVDIEDNNLWGADDESEVVALGTVVADKAYYMTTKWLDNRGGKSTDSGRIQAQFAMSKKGILDYNNCTQSSTVQHTFTYGDNQGKVASIQPQITKSLKAVASTTVPVSNTTSTTNSQSDSQVITEYKAIEPTEDGITKYKSKQKEITKKLKSNKKINDIAVTVTFAEPLSFDEVKTITEKYNVNIEELEARSIDSNGDRITHAIKGLNKSLSQDGSNFIGYTSLQGYVSSENIFGLESEEKIFLVDASGDNNVTELEKDNFAVPLTWYLEDLNPEKHLKK